MKKKLTPLRKKFGPVTLYKDDLEALVNMLEEENGDVTVTIKDADHEYAFGSSKELAQMADLHGKIFHDIDISSHGNIYISCSLDRSSASIYISEGKTLGLGIMVKAIAILKPKNKLLHDIFVSPILIPSAFMYALFTWNSAGSIYSLTIILLSIIWLVSAAIWDFRRYSTLYTKNKDQMPSFFTRKRDDLILAIISGAMGAIFGALITLAIKSN